MATPPSHPITIQSRLTGIWDEWAAIVVAILFWSIVGLIAFIATAQSAKPWDTLIAALAMASQAFFAFMVWRLGQAQYAFARQTAERQHKIDAFPLRSEVIVALQDLGDKHIFTPNGIWPGAEDSFFELSKLVTRLFSNEASDDAYQLYDAVMMAADTKLPYSPNPDRSEENRRRRDEIYKLATDDAVARCNELLERLEKEARIT
ncbi:hypothetical protein [Sphingomonas rubra]|uniref:hypothetical protein n=1 Tax=Sphingomonas rubra TaxID=634430 RepID=UPI00116068EC|nr:hypothetical protein [Sphingomonas rubra]